MRLRADLRRIFANSGWLLGGKGVGGLLSIVYIALATRTLGIGDFGRFAMIVAIGQAVAGFVTFQTWQFVVRYGARPLAEGDEPRLERVIGFAAMLDMASAVVGSLLAAIVVLALAPLFHLPGDLRLPALAFCIASLLSIRSTPIGILRLEDRFREAAMADSVTPVFRVIGTICVAAFFPGIAGFLAAWAVAELGTAAAYWSLALRRRRIAASLRRTLGEEDRPLRFVFATNAGASLSMTIRQLTLLGVGGTAGPAAAGAYRLAAQLAQALAKLTQALQQSLYPELVRANGSGNERRLLIGMSSLAAICGAGILILAASIGRPLLGLIAGPQFEIAYVPMLLLIGACALDLGAVAFEPALVARGHAGRALAVRATATGIQLLLLILLLATIGAIGAAWATLAGSTIALGLSAWRALGLSPPSSAGTSVRRSAPPRSTR